MYSCPFCEEARIMIQDAERNSRTGVGSLIHRRKRVLEDSSQTLTCLAYFVQCIKAHFQLGEQKSTQDVRRSQNTEKLCQKTTMYLQSPLFSLHISFIFLQPTGSSAEYEKGLSQAHRISISRLSSPSRTYAWDIIQQVGICAEMRIVYRTQLIP